MSTAKSEESPPKPVSIAAVVVTFNRLALLQECIAAIRSQTRRPDEIIVVNNSSTDGTAEWLATQPDLTVITQPNSGSAGGQYTGIKTAYHKGHDWFWCMDDDTIPDADALFALVTSQAFRVASTGFLCSITLNSNRIVEHALPTTASIEWFGSVLEQKCIRVPVATFVSVMYSRTAVRNAGLPLQWMFIWGDDFEYAERVSGSFKGWVVLDSRVVHKYAAKPLPNNPYVDASYRFRRKYEIRNNIVRARTLPGQGRFDTLVRLTRETYVASRLILSRRMPLNTFSWIADGLFRRVKYDRV